MNLKHLGAWLIGLSLNAALFSSDVLSANSELIKRGEYLATAGNCAGCHSTSNGIKYAGGVAFKTEFGTIYSTNITPDARTGIGSWSEQDFKQALWHGVRPNGEHLYPAFPYTAYTGLNEQDVSALYHYLKSLPAVDSEPPKNKLDFPFNQRWLLAAWKQLYFTPQRFVADKEQSREWNRGAYLVTNLGHCSACHTPRNFLGAEKKELDLTGGSYQDRLPKGQYRDWHAVDLTSSNKGLDLWSQQDIVDYLKLGINTYATVFGPMNKVVANSTRFLSDDDLQAMATYLKSLPGPTITAPNIDITPINKGETLYAVHCATCHLPTGKGDKDTGPSMIGNPIVEASDPSSLINTILYGPKLPQMQFPIQRTAMDGYDHLLNDEEIAAIANYMRGSWGNTGETVTVDQVLKQR